jgi:hypothetical protein
MTPAPRLAIMASICLAMVLASDRSAPPVLGQGVQFDVNDVSYLWPPPQTAADLSNLIPASDLTTAGSPLWPEPIFTATMAIVRKTAIANAAGTSSQIAFGQFEAELLKPDTWKVAGMRVDPSAPGTDPAVIGVFGSMPQLRIVLQPVTVAGSTARVHDFAVHLVFQYSRGSLTIPFAPEAAAFGEMVAALTALKAAAGTSTEGRLGVHPALLARNQKFAALAKAFIEKFALPARLFAVSFVGVAETQPWIFVTMALGRDGTLVEAPQAVLGDRPAQMLALLSRPAVMPVPSTTNVDERARRGVSTGVLFEDDAPSRLELPVFSTDPQPILKNIPDIVANPARAHFFNTDCVSCHTESTRRRDLGIPAGSAFAFSVPAGISGFDDALLPRSRWNVRNFGWFQELRSSPPVATVTIRTANEAAQSADFINRQYLGQPVVVPPAQ